MGTLTLSEKLKLSILAEDAMADLKSPYKLTEYRRRLRQKVWAELWKDAG